MKRESIKIKLAILLLIFLTGCSANTPSSKIINAPLLNEDYRGIISELKDEGKVITLPMDMESKSITPVDENSGGKYVISYLQKTKDSSKVAYGIAVYKEDNSQWKKIKDVKIGEGDYIDKVIVKDFNGDGNKEIFASVQNYDNTPGLLRGISYSESFFRDYGTLNCNDFALNEELVKGKKTISLVNRKSDGIEVVVMQLDGGKLTAAMSLKTDDPGGKVQIEDGKTSDGLKALMVYTGGIDVTKNMSVIVNRDNSLQNVFNINKFSDVVKKEKLKELCGAAYINNNKDSVICYKSDSQNIDKESLTINKYFDVKSDGDMSLKRRSFIGEDDGFIMRLPMELGQNVFVKRMKNQKVSGNHFQFILSEGTNEIPLFRVVSVEKKDKIDAEGYVMLEESPAHSFYYLLEGKKDVDEKMIKDNFKLIKEK